MTSLIQGMGIQQMAVTTQQINSAIRTRFISQYGHPDNREWLFEGALANVVAHEMQDGTYQVISRELKNGLTEDELKTSLEEKHDDQTDFRSRLEQHLQNYPGALVSPEFRRYHPDFIYQAAAMESTRKDERSGDHIIKGEYAQATCTVTQEITRSHRIKDVKGRNKHLTYEFWQNIREILNQRQ